MRNHVNRQNISLYTSFFVSSLLLFFYTSGIAQAKVKTSDKVAASAKKRIIGFKASRKYSVKQLKTDFDILFNAFKEAHPGFYWYTSKAAFTKKYDSLKKHITHPMTELEFYRLVRPLAVQINCGHTQLYTSVKFRNHFRKKINYFPLHLKFIDGKAYIHKNHSQDSTVRLGLQVAHINGQPIHKVINKLFSYTPSDGFNTTYKYRILDQDFPLLYPYYINAKVDTFSIQCVETQSKQLVHYQLASISRKAYRKSVRKQRQSEAPALQFKMIGGQDDESADNTRPATDHPLKRARVAVLKIKSFQNNTLRKQGFSFSQYIRNVFRTIRKKRVRHLILDLRENSGGTVRNGILLYSYLTKRRFKYFHYEKVATNRPFSFMRYVNSYRSRMVNNKLLVKTDSGYYVSNKLHYNLKTHKPSKYNYKRTLYILINGRSFSATTQFASLVHANKRGVFIGEETGGGYKGCTAGRICYVNLPHTKMRLKIPLIKYSNAIASDYKTEGHGIMPDYELQPKIGDILKGVDTEMEYVLEMIRKKEEE
ncbi:S41 family peptidase [Microscilla marina]|uniref:Peptidase, S41 family n=1 Tax=Microscilla marina ATCC 23134 TaxID=313606 RepID=A1ZHT5_MICM2|nr:S41 family peptidase [Microscilla marina]EAY30092.1 peptidase, S41 family [Microscilla marina ATCC 23134]